LRVRVELARTESATVSSRLRRPIYAACNMSRPIGVALIALGTIIVGFSPARWDTVILVLPRSHGIHIHDLVGTTLVALGTVLLWRLPRPTD